jgi:hypothetical protein
MSSTVVESARLIDSQGHQVLLPASNAVFHIGRDPDNDLVCADSTVSRHHAVLSKAGKRFRLADLESSNGTFVNGQRLGSDPVFLKTADSIRFGTVNFRFHQELRPPSLRYYVVAALVVLATTVTLEELIARNFFRGTSPASGTSAGSQAGSEEASSPGGPNFKAGTQPDNLLGLTGVDLELTLLDPSPTQIIRVVVNGRALVKGCDQTGTDALPGDPADLAGALAGDPNAAKRFTKGHLKQGDTTFFFFPQTCGDELVRVEIYTDRGNVQYQLGSAESP